MKNFSLGLNIALVIAVTFLFYKMYSSKTTTTNANKTAVNTTTTNNASNQIAYVELDSLYTKINYIKAKRLAIEAEQKSIENDIQNGYRNLENKRNEFVKRKGNSITQEEAESFQKELMQDQQNVDERKQINTQKLSEKSYKLMDEIQSNLKSFLEEYNKDKKYQYILTTGTGLDYMLYKDTTHNITNDVIVGMNKKMPK